MRRVNKRKSALKIVKELDAFPKVPESYTQTTTSGGTISLLSYVLIIIFVISEISYYTATELHFKYDVDTEFESKMEIHIDLTIAMPCDTIGADILDVTNQNTHTFGSLEEEPVFFELSPLQRIYWNGFQRINSYIREEYHAIQTLLWRTGFQSGVSEMPTREIKPEGQPDGCRIHGTLKVNKVAGNFHITAGKSIPHPKGHAHLSFFMSPSDYNFSHRIEKFSFGPRTIGIINPMDAEEKVTHDNYQMYQYFVQVVPTTVETSQNSLDTYQYSVSERERVVDHSGGSHGVPGIFVKYDMSSIKVRVIETHKPYWQFAIRLCGIIGGIFATSGMLNLFVSFLVDIICCKYISSPSEDDDHTKAISPNLPQIPVPSKTLPHFDPISLPAYSETTPTNLLVANNHSLHNPVSKQDNEFQDSV